MSLVSGEAVEFDIRFARLGSRTLALLIDIMAQLGLAFLLWVAFSIVVGIFGSFGAADQALAFALLTILLALVFIGYPAGLETLTGGRALGSPAGRARGVREDAAP